MSSNQLLGLDTPELEKLHISLVFGRLRCLCCQRAALPHLTTPSEVLAVSAIFLFFLVPMADSLAQLMRFDSDQGFVVYAVHLAS